VNDPAVDVVAQTVARGFSLVLGGGTAPFRPNSCCLGRARRIKGKGVSTFNVLAPRTSRLDSLMCRTEANTAPNFIVLGVSPDIPLPPSTFLVRTVGVNPSVKIHIFAAPAVSILGFPWPPIFLPPL
jgi:hypothetical protein